MVLNRTSQLLCLYGNGAFGSLYVDVCKPQYDYTHVKKFKINSNKSLLKFFLYYTQFLFNSVLLGSTYYIYKNNV